MNSVIVETSRKEPTMGIDYRTVYCAKCGGHYPIGHGH